MFQEIKAYNTTTSICNYIQYVVAIINPQPETSSPKSETSNPKPETKKSRYYLGKYEKQINHTTNTITEYYYIGGPMGNTAVYISENGETPELYYTITDHLSSIVAIADEGGEIIEEQGYDPWGQYRNPQTGEPEETPQLTMLFRGYTGHEMLPEFGLINMNGRLYDPVIARVLSPDNHVQNPYNPQNYNRYSYCYNNPLVYVDPSGEFIFTSLSAVFCPPLVTFGVMLDGALWGSTFNLGLQTFNVIRGKQNSINWSQLGGAMAGGAVFGLMGMMSPAFNVTSTSFSNNFSTYLGKAGYATLSGALTTASGMIVTDYLDNGKIDYNVRDYIKGIALGGLTSGVMAFGGSMFDYFTWDKYELQHLDFEGNLDLNVKSKMSILNKKFGEISYDPSLIKKGNFSIKTNSDGERYYELTIGPDGLINKGQAYTTASHEQYHLIDWTTSKRPYKRYFGRTFSQQFEINAHKHAMRRFSTPPEVWIDNIYKMKGKYPGYDFKGIAFSFGPAKFLNFFY
ncbi:MAG TPA: RHS repeat-associated core domain-containing protein [Bacteroidales bacterium]|nr:RHS repeat-associated core domain-containing protein [Bacteroidales bacterium]